MGHVSTPSVILILLQSSLKKTAPVSIRNRSITHGICTKLAWILVCLIFQNFLRKPINSKVYTQSTDAIGKLGITPLVQILDSYGQWPMTVSNWTEDRFDWRKASASIRNTFGDTFLFEVSNFVDVNNTEFSTIYVSESKFQFNVESPLTFIYSWTSLP